ncbi:MAG: hemolysin III family protein [Spirochaetota bacterium]
MKRQQSTLEEIGNAITHGMGAIFSIVAWILMLNWSSGQDQQTLKLFAVSIFGFSLLMLYTSSTLYHSITNLKAKRVFKIMDHCSIYLLIAGSYTPFVLIVLNGFWSNFLFFSVWGLAISGIVFKLYFTGRFKKVSTVIYILMGWMAIFAYKPLVESIHIEGLYWVIAGGVVYTFGAIFYLFDKIHMFHMIWHIFVLGGSFLHFLAVVHYVIPYK